MDIIKHYYNIDWEDTPTLCIKVDEVIKILDEIHESDSPFETANQIKISLQDQLSRLDKYGEPVLTLKEILSENYAPPVILKLDDGTLVHRHYSKRTNSGRYVQSGSAPVYRSDMDATGRIYVYRLIRYDNGIYYLQSYDSLADKEYTVEARELPRKQAI